MKRAVRPFFYMSNITARIAASSIAMMMSIFQLPRLVVFQVLRYALQALQCKLASVLSQSFNKASYLDCSVVI